MYTFLINLFCCFTPVIAKLKMSPESLIVHHGRHYTQQYVQDIFVAAGFSAVNKTTQTSVMVHEEGHVYVSVVLLFSYPCCITVTLCCYSDLCNIMFPPHRKLILLLIIYLTYILYMQVLKKISYLCKYLKVDFPRKMLYPKRKQKVTNLYPPS